MSRKTALAVVAAATTLLLAGGDARAIDQCAFAGVLACVEVGEGHGALVQVLTGNAAVQIPVTYNNGTTKGITGVIAYRGAGTFGAFTYCYAPTHRYRVQIRTGGGVRDIQTRLAC